VAAGVVFFIGGTFMKLFSNRIFIFIFAFIFGISAALGVSQLIQGKNEKAKSPSFSMNSDPSEFFDDFFNEDFFGRSRDPFEEMRRMQKQLLNQFDQPDQFQGSFDEWYKGRFGGGDFAEIKQREDDQFVYYDIDLNGKTPKELKVDVKDGQISINGKFESEVDGKDSSSHYFSSSFHRSFPAPSHVDTQNFKMNQEENKIVLKFSKR
jgi:HSP20 family molecular chaperone IbpA